MRPLQHNPMKDAGGCAQTRSGKMVTSGKI